MMMKDEIEREVDEQLRGLERQDWLDIAQGVAVAAACLALIVAACWALPRAGALVMGWLS